MAIRISLLALVCLALTSGAGTPDRPFLQDASVKLRQSAELANATFRKLCIDKDGVVYVLTSKGVARLFDDTLALDRSFRPLAGKVPRDIALGPSGDLYYLLDDRWLSNGQAGKPLGHFPPGTCDRFAIGSDGAVLLSGSAGLFLAHGDQRQQIRSESNGAVTQLYSEGDNFLAIMDGKVARIEPAAGVGLVGPTNATTLARRGDELLVGTHDGYYSIHPHTGATMTPLQTRLPVTDIRRIVGAETGIWFGTSRGVFFLRNDRRLSSPEAAPDATLPDGPHGVRYYASRRWLTDDDVIDLAMDREGHLWVLTSQGLNKIEFRPTTLAAKADYFERKVRSRHIRFGLAGERRLLQAGDVTSSEIIDTDNDGGWSSYYLASQAFRFAVTGLPKARSNAWEVFAALERLQSIHTHKGFPARTFERAGFKFSDRDRWRDVPGNDWEWKGHTSSDEIASQTFAHAVLWECAASSEAERDRIRRNYIAIVEHIIAHQWQLIDVDGQPTLWGRWNPEYVNHYPFTIFDRRLNSAEIIASLQLAHTMTGQARYREKAEELFLQHGYLTNILSSMKLIADTPGYVHLGNQMGDEWNHSDDELAFFTYWVLYRFAFTDALRTQYGAAIREHWEIEREERYPIWNFVYAACGGGGDCDPDRALWTLRGFPLDTVTWRIENSHRRDLTKLPTNFMRREMVERLPPGEHQIARCNTQPFILDGGDGGHIEFPGDEFLLGYWMGRYLKLIE